MCHLRTQVSHETKHVFQPTTLTHMHSIIDVNANRYIYIQMIFVYVHVDLHIIYVIQMYRNMRFGMVTSTSWDLGGSKQIAKSA